MFEEARAGLSHALAPRGAALAATATTGAGAGVRFLGAALTESADDEAAAAAGAAALGAAVGATTRAPAAATG